MADALARAYATTVVALRWPILIAWIAVTTAAVMRLPPLSQRSAGSLGSIVPNDAPALRAERLSASAFGFPLLSRTVLVRRDPGGLPAGVRRRWVNAAAGLTARGDTRAAGAIPLINVQRLGDATREHGTTALAFLLWPPKLTEAQRALAARDVATRFPGRVHITGAVPARLSLTDIIVGRLWIVELATGLLVALVVGVHFRALGAPLVALAVVIVAYLLAERILPWLGERAGIEIPREVAPMIVVLLFGALTDYTIFFLTRFRARLAAGDAPRDAARSTTRGLAGIVTVAAAIVTGASSALLLARFAFFRAFGPGMAAAIAIGWLVVMTLAPALLAAFGRVLFWPARPATPRSDPPARRRMLGVIVRHPWIAALLVLSVLAAGGAGLARLRLSDPVIRDLPAHADAAAGYRAIAAGFGPGFVAPTLVVIRGDDLAARRAALARLARALRRQPGVATVVGPGDAPPLRGALIAQDGRAARLAVVLRDDPLSATAIGRLRALRQRLPALTHSAGLRGAHALVGGDTALAADTIGLATSDLVKVAPAVLVVVLALLGLYLRAVAVPLLLVAASTLGLAAALGATTWLWSWLGHGDLAYYVPFAVAVLLLGLGSDYSVLLVARIWQATGQRPLGSAVADAGTRAGRPIGVAGLVLAGSFALLAIVPVGQFRQFAMAMACGLLLDAFVIRPLLVPALVVVAARRGAAPAGRRLRGRSRRSPA